MQPKRVDRWIWILVYGGLLGVSLGWFLEARNEPAGWTMMVAGAALAGVGAVLILVRSRMGP